VPDPGAEGMGGKRPREAYYAVQQGREVGVYSSWAEAEARVKGFPGAVHKRFDSEADARAFAAGTSGTYTSAKRPAVFPGGQRHESGPSCRHVSSVPPSHTARADSPDESPAGVPRSAPEKPAHSEVYKLMFDGGSRSNSHTGVAGSGAVIMDSKGQEVAAMAGFTEQTTNNRAEYMALVAGLRCAAAMGIKKLEIEGCGAVRSGYELSSPPGVAVAPVRCQVSYTCPRFARRDSKLVVEQLKGKWQCNQHGLSVLRDEAQALMGRFDSASIRHVPRAQNTRADELSNRAMDRQGWEGAVDPSGRQRLSDEAAKSLWRPPKGWDDFTRRQ